MARAKTYLRRGITDFVFALLLFWAVALSFGTHNSKALAVPLPALGILHTSADSKPTIHASLFAVAEGRASHGMRVARGRALAVLSITFAALVALNLAFWRHLRRVYASPRRGGWRRG